MPRTELAVMPAGSFDGSKVNAPFFDGVKKKKTRQQRPLGRGDLNCSCSICTTGIDTLGCRCWKTVIEFMLKELATPDDPWVSTRQMCAFAETHWYRIWDAESIPKRVHWQRTLTMTLSKGNGTRYESGRDHKGTKGFWQLLARPSSSSSAKAPSRPGSVPSPVGSPMMMMLPPRDHQALRFSGRAVSSTLLFNQSPSAAVQVMPMPEKSSSSSSLDVLAEIAAELSSSNEFAEADGGLTRFRTRFGQSTEPRVALAPLAPRSASAQDRSLPPFEHLVTHTTMTPRDSNSGSTFTARYRENSPAPLRSPLPQFRFSCCQAAQPQALPFTSSSFVGASNLALVLPPKQN